MLENADVKVVIVEDDGQLEKVRQRRDHLPALEHVVRMTGRSDDAISFEDPDLERCRPRGIRVGDRLAGSPSCARWRLASAFHPGTPIGSLLDPTEKHEPRRSVEIGLSI